MTARTGKSAAEMETAGPAAEAPSSLLSLPIY